MRVVASLVVASALLAGGAGIGTAARGGWSEHDVSSGGFAIETPSNWFDPTATSESKALSQVAAMYPALAASVQIARSSKLIQLICVDPRGYPNLSAGESVSPGITLARLVAESVSEAHRLRFISGPISVAAIRLPAGAAERLGYEIQLAGEVVIERQYVLLRRGRAYVLTYSALPPAAASSRAVIARSVRSFRFIT